MNMGPEIFKYLLTTFFVAITFYLSYLGMKKTKTMKGFAIGNKDMKPELVGITMAASISSTATFVINPGFVYTHGLSAFMHFGVGAVLGIMTAFLLLTKGFRALGEKQGSLTIPHWIYERFGSRAYSLFFAFLNLLSITFVVLILVGCSMLLSSIFPIDQKVSLIVSLLFVFSYVLLGGTYAHAYTNTFQAILMIVISLFLFFNGIHLFEGDFIGTLKKIGPNYASVFNKESVLYYDLFSVYISAFLISFALMFQPHIFTKILYLKEDKDVKRFLITTIIVGSIFSLMLFIGFYAKLSGVIVPRQDMIVTAYIQQQFSVGAVAPYLSVFIVLTLLAAGLSTLDGILVSLSAMVVNDIYMPLSKNSDQSKGLILSRYVLVFIGLVSFALAWNPPKLVGIFAQKGVYALAAASFVPIIFGVLYKKEIPVRIIAATSLIAVIGHFYLNSFAGFINPSVSSSISMLCSLAFMLLFVAYRKFIVK